MPDNRTISSFTQKSLTANERLARSKEHFASQEFSRKHYLQPFKTISTATATATASRDLKQAVDSKFLTKTGEKALTSIAISNLDINIPNPLPPASCNKERG